jgi:hypothetical protein
VVLDSVGMMVHKPWSPLTAVEHIISELTVTWQVSDRSVTTRHGRVKGAVYPSYRVERNVWPATILAKAWRRSDAYHPPA